MEIRRRLPQGARVRRDRGPGLFVSRELISSPFFRCQPLGDLWRLTPTPALLAELEGAEPREALALSLARFRGLPADEEALALFCAIAKAAEARDAACASALERALRRRAALCLRAGGGGGLYACALILERIGGTER